MLLRPNGNQHNHSMGAAASPALFLQAPLSASLPQRQWGERWQEEGQTDGVHSQRAATRPRRASCQSHAVCGCRWASADLVLAW